MKETLNAARVGFFLLLGLSLFYIVYQSLGDGALFRDRGYTLHAEFANLQQLKTGDDVRMAGVKIGTVRETILREGRATAVLVIDHDVQIPRDSKATIILSGLIGTNLIDIRYGKESDFLKAGDHLETEASTDLNQILSQIGDLGDRVDYFFQEIGESLEAITGDEDTPGLFQSINEMVVENRESIRNATANIEKITDTLARGEGTIGRLLTDDEIYNSIQTITRDLEQVAGNAKGFSGDIQDLVQEVRDIVQRVESGEGTVGRLLSDDTIAREIEVVAKNLREISDRLNAGEGTLGKLLSDDSLYYEATAVLRKAESTLDGLGNQGPITAVGVAASALF